MERIQYTYFGLDLGQRNDYSAIAVIDLVEDISAHRDPVTFEFYRTHKFCLRGVHRFPLGTPYTEMPALVRECVVHPPPGHFAKLPQSVLAIDAGGPGVPVVELIRQARLDPVVLPVFITGGAMGSLLPNGMYSVPRRELVTLLRLSLENQKLVFPASMPLKDELSAEIAAIQPNGGQTKHDDMAIAIALALWSSTKRHPGLLQRQAA